MIGRKGKVTQNNICKIYIDHTHNNGNESRTNTNFDTHFIIKHFVLATALYSKCTLSSSDAAAH